MRKIACVLGILIQGSLAHAAVYGLDGRQELVNVPLKKWMTTSIAVAVGHNLILPNADGTSRIDMVDTFGPGMCKNERFLNQPSLGFCTGFLVGDRYLMTAGHCGLATGTIEENGPAPFCDDIDWYFGFAVNAQGKTNDQAIPKDRIYRCKRAIRVENIEHLGGDPLATFGNDFALIELDRPVSSDIKPLPLAASEPKVGELVYTIGHPYGLPMKFSGLAPVNRNVEVAYFEANLDTASGNSGGPVFNSHDELVGILVSGHPIDMSHDKTNKCDRWNKCNESGTQCAEQPHFPGQQVSNFIQRLTEVKKLIPKN